MTTLSNEDGSMIFDPTDVIGYDTIHDRMRDLIEASTSPPHAAVAVLNAAFAAAHGTLGPSALETVLITALGNLADADAQMRTGLQ